MCRYGAALPGTVELPTMIGTGQTPIANETKAESDAAMRAPILPSVNYAIGTTPEYQFLTIQTHGRNVTRSNIGRERDWDHG